MFDSIEKAISDIQYGRIIIVVDDENRENEGDFVMAAEKASPQAVNFMAMHGRGLICAPVSQDTAEKMQLPIMVQDNKESMSTAFTVSVDAKSGITTGISAQDRSRTLSILANELCDGRDLVRPGHIFPLIARQNGVLERPGHTEAAVDFCTLAGLAPAGVICEILNEDGTCARLPELKKLAKKHNLTLVSIEQLIEYRKNLVLIQNKRNAHEQSLRR